jgi:hypothetical protein
VRLLLLLLFAALSFHAYPQQSPVENLDIPEYYDQIDEEKDFVGTNDTLKLTTRSFSSSDINELKSDPELNYEQPPTIAESLWDRFKQWVAWFFENLFDKVVSTDLGRILMYTLAGVLLIIVIMMLLKVNAFRVFYSGADQSRMPYQVFSENIHEMDFEKLIQEASDKNDFRLATRLIFLYALKILSDKHLIEFNPGKTNHDFVEELHVADLKTGLNELSYYFEYAWYGNFLITDSQFNKIKNTFTEWRTRIK